MRNFFFTIIFVLRDLAFCWCCLGLGGTAVRAARNLPSCRDARSGLLEIGVFVSALLYKSTAVN